MFRMFTGKQKQWDSDKGDYRPSPAPTRVRIGGTSCLANGVEAIDFRRAHGLPDGPGPDIDLAPAVYQSEEWTRALGDLDSCADIDLSDCRAYSGRVDVDRDGSVSVRIFAPSGTGYYPEVEPHVLRAYLDAPSAETFAAVIRSAREQPARLRAALEAEAEVKRGELAERARKISEARALLADELRDLTQRAERAEKSAEYWESEAKEARAEVERIETDAAAE